METPIYVSLSRMMALRHQMDVVANNVANATTTGFKQERVQFAEFLDKPANGERVSLVQDRTTVRDLSPGPVSATSNPLDVAISGKGWFAVDTLNGPHYTRAGRFQLDAKGTIVDNNGLPVMGTGNRPITLPTGTTRINITGDGSVFSDANPLTPVGRIGVVNFQKEQQMTEVGSGLFTTDEIPTPAAKDTKITQGAIEESNVKPVIEMTNMINVLRQYQGMQKIVDAEHERLKNMIQKLGRSS
ncbi:MAG: flagellar basal-body rod protein FlgF [Rhodospirillaceae bacterium]